MNGFANSLLSILLSWIRALVANIWVIINSEDGGTAYRFFAQNWLNLLVVLLISGFIVDRIIYIIRWRPHYVWLSRVDRMRKKRRKAPESGQEPVFSSDPVPEIAASTRVYQPVPVPTIAYAPVKTAYSKPAEVYTQVYAPTAAEEPVFDEPVSEWEEEEWQPAAAQERPQHVSADYYRDMQAGFAPAVPPEQLYAPRRRSAVQEQPSAPVHPGLDDETFRQSVGLQEEQPEPVAVMRAPAFRPFTAIKEESEPVRPQSALSRLARRARTLVGVENDDQPLTIRDLHSTVDVSKAFHEPVYPQSMKIDE
ncbi:MAG: hypothetical protein J6K55_05650 [Clostridia bacterium]|nr:hypothetical protein [Clostridia bacterium]